MIVIERSRLSDGRWCVASRYRETLCPGRAIPLVFTVTVICWLFDRRRSRRVFGALGAFDDRR